MSRIVWREGDRLCVNVAALEILEGLTPAIRAAEHAERVKKARQDGAAKSQKKRSKKAARRNAKARKGAEQLKRLEDLSDRNIAKRLKVGKNRVPKILGKKR